MGVEQPIGFRSKISKTQKLVAHNLILQAGRCDFARPVRGFELRELPERPCPWQVAPDLSVPQVYKLYEEGYARKLSSIRDLIPFDESPHTYC
jgi:hypothetical protein